MTDFKKLHKKIQRQGQQGGILFLLTIPGHEQKQQYDYQIPGVEILRQQPPQKAGGTGVGGLRRRVGLLGMLTGAGQTPGWGHGRLLLFRGRRLWGWGDLASGGEGRGSGILLLW